MTRTKSTYLALLAVLLSPMAANAGSILYVAHGGAAVGAPLGGEIGTIDLITGAYTSLGTPTAGLGVTGLAWDGSALWGVSSNDGSGQNLIQINPLTGGLISSMAIGGDPYSQVNDLAYDPVTGLLYAAARGAAGDAVYTLDTVSAALGFVGVVPSTDGGFGAIAFAPDGSLYAQRTFGDTVHQIDPITGDLIDSIVTGLAAGALGLTYDATNGVLIGSGCCSGEYDTLYSQNLATGTFSTLFDYGDGRRMQDFAFVDIAVPEPGTLALLGLGLLGMGAARRRKKV